VLMVASVQADANVALSTMDDQRREAERTAILHALSRANNNRTTAARLLGVSRRTFYNKLAALGLGESGGT
jgi:DNA-binding NtrC family response regulator